MRKDTTHSGWSLKDSLELPHTLVGAVYAERALDFGRYAVGRKTEVNDLYGIKSKSSCSPFSFKNKPL